MRNTLADNEKAKRILGFSPKTDIEEGLTKEFEWIKEAKTKGII